jgi:hypothetical protein
VEWIDDTKTSLIQPLFAVAYTLGICGGNMVSHLVRSMLFTYTLVDKTCQLSIHLHQVHHYKSQVALALDSYPTQETI